MWVTLTNNELTIVKAVARARTRRNVDANTQRPWAQEGNTEQERLKNRYENDYQAFAAEFAFCKALNLMPDFTTHNRDGGYDCLLPDGSTVDVKETHYQTGKLLIKVERNKGKLTANDSCDIYVLLIGKAPKFKIAGFATNEMAFTAPVVQQKHSQSYTLAQDKLLPVKELKKYGINLIYTA